MKRSASTEYSIDGGTALLVPPYKTYIEGILWITDLIFMKLKRIL
jgi:hypothetical protein